MAGHGEMSPGLGTSHQLCSSAWGRGGQPWGDVTWLEDKPSAPSSARAALGRCDLAWGQSMALSLTEGHGHQPWVDVPWVVEKPPPLSPAWGLGHQPQGVVPCLGDKPPALSLGWETVASSRTSHRCRPWLGDRVPGPRVTSPGLGTSRWLRPLPRRWHLGAGVTFLGSGTSHRLWPQLGDGVTGPGVATPALGTRRWPCHRRRDRVPTLGTGFVPILGRGRPPPGCPPLARGQATALGTV